MEKREKGQKKSKEISALCVSYTQDTSTICRYVQNSKTLAFLGTEKYVINNFIGEKEKLTKNGMISTRMLILSYTTQEVVANVYTKFQSPRCCSS